MVSIDGAEIRDVRGTGSVYKGSIPRLRFGTFSRHHEQKTEILLSEAWPPLALAHERARKESNL